MRETLRPAERLVLDLTDSTVMITADERSQLLSTDGRKAEGSTPDGRQLETRAHWKDGSLRIERRIAGAFQVSDVYTLSYSGNRLEDERTVERSDRPGPAMQLHLIYDRQQDGSH